MDYIGVVVRGSQRIEAFLKSNFGAEGKGLHEILTSVENQIPQHLVKRIRYTASVRNRVVHEAAELDDAEGFAASIESILNELQSIVDAREAARRSKAFGKTNTVGPNSGPVVITKIPFWVKAAIVILIVYALSLNSRLADKTEKIAVLQARLKIAESQPPQRNNTDGITSSAMHGTSTGQNDIIDVLRKELLVAQEESKKLREALKISKAVKNNEAKPEPNNAPSTNEQNTNNGRSVNLLDAAQKTESDKERGQAAISDGIKAILSRARIDIGKVDVLNGSVHVQVGWSIDVTSINKLLSDHLKIDRSSDSIEISSYQQEEFRSYSSSLLASLRKKTANLVVQVGPKIGQLKIGGDAHCHVGCSFSSAFGMNSFYLDGVHKLGGNSPKVLEIIGLSNADLAKVDQLKAWIEWK